ncbi:MAG: ChbG/HpnK family deacetylase [bacterium]|nr:ChbG/HpnK family deacetylase [bacterium]
MKQLIVNADDFGLTEGINKGIIRAFAEGIVTSTSLMANGQAFEQAISLLQDNSSLAVGVHIVLVEEVPVCPSHLVPTLIDKKGRLHKKYGVFLRKILLKQISLDEVEQEIRAQIEKVLNAGIKPSHIDSHQHLHVYPLILKIVLRLAKEYGIKWIRTPCDYRRPCGIAQRGLAFLAKQARKRILKAQLQTPDFFFGAGFSGHMTEENLVEVIDKLPDGVSELMCHPGVAEYDLITKYNFSWADELRVLISIETRELIQKRGIALVNYDDLSETKGWI